jgi:hypothetical protein
VIGELNNAVAGVGGTGVKFVDNVAGLGTHPVSDGYISTNRLYGYPHPSTTGTLSGQTKMAGSAVTDLLGSGW